ncbi:MAG TPA: TlpA disulfide reductase family protein [Planctomycetota bacterium]|nr:TlpA disulfide reductase family protein [Planctomycetota bacterium]
MASPRRPVAVNAVMMLLALMPALDAADVGELIEEIRVAIPAEELVEPGNTALATALDELVADSELSPAERIEVQSHAAEAWLLANDHAAAQQRAQAVLADGEATPALRERAGLALVAAWQLQLKGAEKPADLPSPVDAVAAFGDLGAKVQARAHSAEGERRLALKENDAAIERFDRALALLKDAPPAERVPLYALRLLAMEQAKKPADEIQRWLEERSSDPAAQQVIDSALTSGQRLVGQQAPPLAAKRLDAAGDFALADLKGKPVLVAFVASWARTCDEYAPVIAAFATAHPEVGVVGVSLDTKDTLANLPGWVAKHGIAFPMVGDGIGWDSELDDAFGVEGIPHLILVGADGRIAAVDLIGEDPADTARNLEQALAKIMRGDAPAEAAIP